MTTDIGVAYAAYLHGLSDSDPRFAELAAMWKHDEPRRDVLDDEAAIERAVER